MKKMIKSWSVQSICMIAITIALVTLEYSCKKTETNNTDFTGTYVGTLVTPYLSEGDTVIVSAGSSAAQVVMVSHTARGSVYTINGTVSGTTLNIPSQQVYVASMGSTYTTTGGGGLSGTTLTINYSFSGTNMTFTGARQ
jgi:hypothetical protein